MGMEFRLFSQYLTQLEQTASRLEMTTVLAELYSHLAISEVQHASYLLQGTILPAYYSLEFQLSEKMVTRALARCYAAPQEAEALSLFGESDNVSAEAYVTQLVRKVGDIGTATEEICREHTGQENMQIEDVYADLLAIAHEGGEGSQERKIDAVTNLLKRLDPVSAKYVARSIVGSMRLGFSTMTMLDALSWTKTGSKAEASLLEDAYQRRADVGLLAKEYLAHDEASARHAALLAYSGAYGVPIVPQLCQRLNSTSEMIQKMHEVYAEPKYDGLRVQIHCQRTKATQEIKVFTRNLEDASHMFPELNELLTAAIPEGSFVLDGEAIGYDPQTGMLRSFQETITRKRKHNVAETTAKVPLKFFIFDVLMMNGDSLIHKTLQERKNLLNRLFSDSEQIIKTSYIITKDPEELQKYHEEQLALGLEGMVVKAVNSPYQSGRKGWYWVKIKEQEGKRGKLTDTVDCIVMGYFAGKGQRSSFGAGTFLLGVLSGDETILTISKVGSGLTEQSLQELKNLCDEHITHEKPLQYQVSKNLYPHVWVQPRIVVEVAADELTYSPIHTAGLALRFPRVVAIRSDKKIEDATTREELEEMLVLQQRSEQPEQLD